MTYFYDCDDKKVIYQVISNPLYDCKQITKPFEIVPPPQPPPKGWYGKAHHNPLYVETSIDAICKKADVFFEKISIKTQRN